METVTHTHSTSPTTETLKIGSLTLRILSPPSQTPHFSTITFTLPPRSSGFPLHFHRQHTTSFLILRGTVRFTTTSPPSTISPSSASPASPSQAIPQTLDQIDAKAGSHISIPVGVAYGFSNPSTQGAEMVATYSAGYYVDCLRECATIQKEKGMLSVEERRGVLLGWGTVFFDEAQIESKAEKGSEKVEEEEEDEDMDEDSGEEEVAVRETGLRCMA